MNTASQEVVRGPRAWILLAALTLVSIFSQIDRILPYILAESIRTELGLSDTQIGLITGLAFAVCYTLFSLPLARAADRGSPVPGRRRSPPVSAWWRPDCSDPLSPRSWSA